MLDECFKPLSIRHQCKLLNINRSNLYYKKIESEDTEIANLIYEMWIENPMYGYRKITKQLNKQKINTNHKKVLKIMQEMEIQALYQKPKLSRKDANNKKYPYLLKDLIIIRPNQVWATDITYIKIPGGYIYLIAIIDWCSRFVLDWQISNSMDVNFCLNTLKSALSRNIPEILNTDQGSQFTSDSWINLVKSSNIKISMDGKGRWADNVIIERFWRTLKYEGIFLEIPSTIIETKKTIDKFIKWYNYERLHQSLNYKTPAEVYENNLPPASL